MRGLLLTAFILLSAIAHSQDATLIPYRKGDQWGYCDKNKNIIIPIIYDRAEPFKKGVALVSNGRFEGFIDTTGKEVVPMKYSIQLFSEGLAIISYRGKYGYVNEQGKIVIPMKYSWAEEFRGGKAEVTLGDKRGKIDKKGNVIEPFVAFQEDFSTELMEIFGNPHDSTVYLVSNYSEELAVVTKNGKYGYINKDKELVIPFKYTIAKPFENGIAEVTMEQPGQDRKEPYTDSNGVIHASAIFLSEGYIDRNGTEYWEEFERWIVPPPASAPADPAYKIPDPQLPELIPYRTPQGWGYSDSKGNIVIAPGYNNAERLQENVLIVSTGPVSSGEMRFPGEEEAEREPTLYFLADKTGKPIKKGKFYSSISDLHEGLASAYFDTTVGYLDTKGNYFTVKGHTAYEFHEGRAIVIGDNEFYGVVNRKGKFVVQPMYDLIRDYSEGLALVELEGKYGYIDTTGKVVIPVKFAGAGSFNEGYAYARLEGKWGYIDKTGKFIIEPKYEKVNFLMHDGLPPDGFHEGLASARSNGKWGMINTKGETMIPFMFQEVSIFTEGLMAVKLNDKYGYIDKKGNTVIPFNFEKAYEFHEGLACVEINGKRGYIDRSGKLVISPDYQYAGKFKDGIAFVTKSWGNSFYIDRKGFEYRKTK